MKPMLMTIMLLSLCLTQQARAGGAARANEDVDGLHARTIEEGDHSSTSSLAEWTDHNIHDPGITILEAVLRAVKRIHRALIRFGDGIRGRIPVN